jgi:hypothetical protein
MIWICRAGETRVIDDWRELLSVNIMLGDAGFTRPTCLAVFARRQWSGEVIALQFIALTPKRGPPKRGQIYFWLVVCYWLIVLHLNRLNNNRWKAVPSFQLVITPPAKPNLLSRPQRRKQRAHFFFVEL